MDLISWTNIHEAIWQWVFNNSFSRRNQGDDPLSITAAQTVVKYSVEVAEKPFVLPNFQRCDYTCDLRLVASLIERYVRPGFTGQVEDLEIAAIEYFMGEE